MVNGCCSQLLAPHGAVLQVCCGKVLRASFLVLAAPLLFTGSVFHHLGHRLQQNGVNNAEYATGEFAAAGSLDKMATQSVVTAEEDQAMALDLEGDVTINDGAAGVAEASAGEEAGVIGGDEVAAAGEAGTAAVVQEVPGVNVAADATEGAAILGQEVSAAGAAAAFLKNEAFAAEEGAQSVADGNLAVEKEVEATSLRASSATEEAASVSAKQQAGKAGLVATGFMVEAGFCQLVSIAVQAPVAMFLIAKWSTSAVAGPCSTLCVFASSGMAGKSMMLPVSWMMSRLTLAAALGSLVAAPWAATVLAASFDGEDLASEVGAIVKRVSGDEQVEAASTHRLLSAKHKEPSFLGGLNPFAKPNTVTTTVRPTSLPPPEQEGRWHMIGAAARTTVEPMLKWTWPVFIDIGVISAVFAAATLAAGVGRHVPAIKQGRVSHHTALLTTSRDVVTCWIWGLMVLLAVWVLSIMLAKELRTAAQHVHSWHVAQLSPVCVAVVICCLAAHIMHGYVQSLSPEDEDSTFARADAPSDSNYAPVITDLESSSASGVAVAGTASCVCAAAVAMAEILLQAAEGPVNAWAVGGSYKAVVMASAIAAATPWQDLLPPWMHSMPPALLWMVLGSLFVGLLVVLAGVCRWVARGPARGALSSESPMPSDYSGAAE